MIPPVQAIRRILWGNVRLDNKLIPVIKRSYPYDKTPCVTVDDSGSSSLVERHILSVDYPLDNTHPQFNPQDPFHKYPQEVLREYYNTTININIWSDSIDEQEKLNNIVQDLFYKVQSDHFMFCEHYYDGECTSMGCGCYGELSQYDKRGVKKQCPKPLVYGYSNIFNTYNLIRASFHLDPPFNLDDTNRDEIVYRSVLKLSTAYYIDHIIGGKQLDSVEYSDEVML